ncbi:chemotaxis protein CheB [Puteibacter caeruleilacunae]|nr:chemotaxis protein CheB [Puteibacter caeruleilacunae]
MYKAIVIGTSYGGLEAIKAIIPKLPKDFPLALLIVLHIGDNDNTTFINLLNDSSEILIKEAEEKESIKPGIVYFAPPNYHLLVEKDETISLSTEPKVNFSRPSIDVLFESASWVYRDQLIGIVMSGANSDGADGLKLIKANGGTTIVENPCSSYAPTMPRAALKSTKPDYRLKLEAIKDQLMKLAGYNI